MQDAGTDPDDVFKQLRNIAAEFHQVISTVHGRAENAVEFVQLVKGELYIFPGNRRTVRSERFDHRCSARLTRKTQSDGRPDARWAAATSHNQIARNVEKSRRNRPRSADRPLIETPAPDCPETRKPVSPRLVDQSARPVGSPGRGCLQKTPNVRIRYPRMEL